MQWIAIAFAGWLSMCQAPRPRFAAVQLDGDWEECSNMGGEHAAFAIDGIGGHAHAGGHDRHLGLGTGISSDSRVPARRWFVAELSFGTTSFADGGWCLGGMPAFDAEVEHLWPAASRAVAERMAAAGRPVDPAVYSRQ